MDVPTSPEPLVVTAAAANFLPTPMGKVEIVLATSVAERAVPGSLPGTIMHGRSAAVAASPPARSQGSSA